MPKMKVAAGVLVAAMAWSQITWAAPPEPYTVTDDLVAAATKEGAVVYYTSTDVQIAEKLGAAF